MNKINFIDHKLNYDLWESKKSLFIAFYGAFYDFIKNHNGEDDLKSKNIFTKDDFYKYADYYADGKDNCYAMGFAFHKYFLTPSMNIAVEKQPTSTFIGYCYQNDMFKDFINFLISYFAYWRNDEGCTSFDPYNYADHFFVSSWAALVDTSKLFYFSSETVYFWQSYRIKYVLDHIPGVFLTNTNSLTPRIAGYEFLGWYDENGKEIVASDDLKRETLFGKLKRRDIYNYWEKEEKKIKKVYIENWKKADPA